MRPTLHTAEAATSPRARRQLDQSRRAPTRLRGGEGGHQREEGGGREGGGDGGRGRRGRKSGRGVRLRLRLRESESGDRWRKERAGRGIENDGNRR
eukprot:4260503-Pleurochrysis_carterae.AAC.1